MQQRGLGLNSNEGTPVDRPCSHVIDLATQRHRGTWRLAEPSPFQPRTHGKELEPTETNARVNGTVNTLQ